MSKKFGINTKSAEARARKDAVKQANEREKQQKLEDEYWKDDDKHVQKKQQRRNDQEQKEHEKMQRKQEIQRLLEQEEAALSASKAKAKPELAPRKVTQAQIQQRHAEAAAAIQNEKPKRTNLIENDETPIEENVNRLTIDGASARNVDDAIQVLQDSSLSVDRHPEKRMKAAYDAYEAENLPKLKQEHPTLRLSQLKQVLKKQWMKAPENPFNKPTVAYNEGSVSKQRDLPEQNESDEDDH